MELWNALATISLSLSDDLHIDPTTVGNPESSKIACSIAMDRVTDGKGGHFSYWEIVWCQGKLKSRRLSCDGGGMVDSNESLVNQHRGVFVADEVGLKSVRRAQHVKAPRSPATAQLRTARVRKIKKNKRSENKGRIEQVLYQL
ncbi:hypothetical protein FRB95_010619 [Tulasnella sp. JGI-2019a]|nr:hypothetical protein FRB93_003082 [Tulasnella sp. JGI-2019a]KAG9025025.1 hypothetical protein FRB95_010619 [Tulasnella sp. JGI-2019a]